MISHFPIPPHPRICAACSQFSIAATWCQWTCPGSHWICFPASWRPCRLARVPQRLGCLRLLRPRGAALLSAGPCSRAARGSNSSNNRALYIWLRGISHNNSSSSNNSIQYRQKLHRSSSSSKILSFRRQCTTWTAKKKKVSAFVLFLIHLSTRRVAT